MSFSVSRLRGDLGIKLMRRPVRSIQVPCLRPNIFSSANVQVLERLGNCEDFEMDIAARGEKVKGRNFIIKVILIILQNKFI